VDASGSLLLPLPLLLLAGDGVDTNGVGSVAGGERESNSKRCASAITGVIRPWLFQNMAISTVFFGSKKN
jgi:hypothetical protein